MEELFRQSFALDRSLSIIHQRNHHSLARSNTLLEVSNTLSCKMKFITAILSLALAAAVSAQGGMSLAGLLSNPVY